jgi:hypothetical protein
MVKLLNLTDTTPLRGGLVLPRRQPEISLGESPIGATSRRRRAGLGSAGNGNPDQLADPERHTGGGKTNH